MSQDILFTVTDFVAVFNQTINYAYPVVTIEGELSNFRVSKNRWVYFDLKDEYSSVKFFGTIYQLPGPLTDGMLLKVSGAPQLHPQFGFSINVQLISLTGEGTIKKASKLLEAKLQKEGLFDTSRKRTIPYPPRSLGLITSGESAAFSDFTKILNARWAGVEILHYDVQVQGDDAPKQIVSAISHFNQLSNPPEVLVITRGGGSLDDLQVFSIEQVARAIAGSRAPTLVAIGHERDVSLAERVADVHASTPSNAAELLVPDKNDVISHAEQRAVIVEQLVKSIINNTRHEIDRIIEMMAHKIESKVENSKLFLKSREDILGSLNPQNVLKRGYSVVRKNNSVVKSKTAVIAGDEVVIEFYDGTTKAEVQ